VPTPQATARKETNSGPLTAGLRSETRAAHPLRPVIFKPGFVVLIARVAVRVYSQHPALPVPPELLLQHCPKLSPNSDDGSPHSQGTASSIIRDAHCEKSTASRGHQPHARNPRTVFASSTPGSRVLSLVHNSRPNRNDKYIV